MPEHSLQETGGKPFLYLPQAFVGTLGWEKGDDIQVDLVSMREGQQEIRLRRVGEADATGRPILRDTEKHVRIEVDGEVISLKRSHIDYPTKERPALVVPAQGIMQAADVDFPEEKVLSAADGSLEWGQNAEVDLREHRRFDVRDKPDFGGG